MNPTTEARGTMSSSDEVGRLQEQLWVLRAQRGDADAFRHLVDAYERRLLYFVLRFVNDADDALDVLQDVWLTVFRRLPRLHAPGAFRVWLYQIARARAVTLVRGERREARALDEVRGSVEAEQAGEDLSFENAELVHRALQALSLDHREVLALHFLEDLRLEEIAEVLHCPLGTVKSRLYYAKRALRHEVERLAHG